MNWRLKHEGTLQVLGAKIAYLGELNTGQDSAEAI